MRLIDEDKVISVIERFIGYIDEDMIERIKIAIKKSVPTAASELTVESDPIIKRLRHLLESEYIRSFDEVDPHTQEYKRDIREADKGREVTEITGFSTSSISNEMIKRFGIEIENKVKEEVLRSIAWQLLDSGAITIERIEDRARQMTVYIGRGLVLKSEKNDVYKNDKK